MGLQEIHDNFRCIFANNQRRLRPSSCMEWLQSFGCGCPVFGNICFLIGLSLLQKLCNRDSGVFTSFSFTFLALRLSSLSRILQDFRSRKFTMGNAPISWTTLLFCFRCMRLFVKFPGLAGSSRFPSLLCDCRFRLQF